MFYDLQRQNMACLRLILMNKHAMFYSALFIELANTLAHISFVAVDIRMTSPVCDSELAAEDALSITTSDYLLSWRVMM